jgi:hypothetical protein
MRSFVLWLAASWVLVGASACGPPQLTLAQLAPTAKVSATRDGRNTVKVVLSWDEKKVACGTVTNLVGRIDEETGTVTGGTPKEDKTCEFPTLSVNPMSASRDRVIVFDDGRSKITMTVTTLEAPTASAVSMVRNVRVGDDVVWTFSGSGGDVGPWRIFYTPTNGTAAQWADGTGPIMSVGTTVPASAANSSGTVGLAWSALAVIRGCEGAQTCEATVTDQAAYAISVSP